jgi:DNA-binding transcriptional LysR family regulator
MSAKKAAIQNSEHPPLGVHADASPPAGLTAPGATAETADQLLAHARWDDLRAFLDVANAASFRAAAAALKISVNTVRAKMDRLEQAIGTSLFERSPEGLKLTSEGARLKPIVLKMHSDASTDSAGTRPYRLVRPGEIRIGASEALGSGWLTPRILELQAQFPELTVTLLCDYDIESERSADLDVGILWHRPKNPDLIVARLATLHFMPFASRAYIEKFGAPSSMDDLLKHRYIEQVAPGVKSSLLDQMVGSDRPIGFLPLRTNSSLALFWAVATGAGIAWMPTYSMAVTRQLVPIDLPFQLKFDIFYYYHPEAADALPVRATINWLKTIFDSKPYPWFRQEFVHPDDFFQPGERSGNIIQLFEPLLGDVLLKPHLGNRRR